MKMGYWSVAAIGVAICVSTAPAAHAQKDSVTIGVTVSSTGPGASLGIPEKQAFGMLPATLGGYPVRYVVLDDATDPSVATRNARRLIDEEQADAIIGSSTVPASLAVAVAAAQGATPAIGLSPYVAKPDVLPWSFSLPQPIGVMADGLVENMAARKLRSLAFVGFNDSYGEAWLNAIRSRAQSAGIDLVATERYSRTDNSVAAQVIKVVGAKPDAVLIAGSGTPAATPMTALRDRGYKGIIYQTHGVANNDFIRVGGKSAEGAILPSGALLVAEQLPPAHPSKAVATDFVQRYEARYGAGSRDLFAGYAYDAYLLLDHAVSQVPKSVKPGTADFRQALRDAIGATRGVPGTHGTINVDPAEHFGYGADGRVLVQVEGGRWRITQ